MVAAITDDVHALGLQRADALHLAVLERAQQLGLHRQRQLADLVEEQRAAVRRLEHAGLRFDGAGERAAHVAEQLALEQRVDDRRAVDRDERLACAGPGLMERARGEFLAGAGLAADQHDLRVRRQPLNQAEHLLHHRAAAEHAAELELARDLALERDAPARGARARARMSLEHLPEAIEVERLGEVLARAELDRLDGAVDGGVGRSSGSLRSPARWCGSAAADRGR